MIRYQLRCAGGHEFEGWFKSSAAFDEQARRGAVSCPSCGDSRVEKAIMAPSIARTDRGRSRRRPSEPASAPVVAAPQPATHRPAPAALVNEEQRRIFSQMRELRDKLLANSEYVGPRFAEEARRIHDREAPERGIYGEATAAEVEALHEDGIEVLPIPILPDDKN